MTFDPTALLVLLVLFFCGSMQAVSPLNVQEPLWSFEFKEVFANSSNEELLRYYDWKIERISRGVFAISGKYALNYDIVEGDSTEIEMLVYRSENGVKPYITTPFKLQPKHYVDFYNTYYKEFAMEAIKNCSNFPVFADKIELPVEKKIYSMNKCQFSTDSFPRYLSEGFYRVDAVGHGAVEWILSVVAEVTST